VFRSAVGAGCERRTTWWVQPPSRRRSTLTFVPAMHWRRRDTRERAEADEQPVDDRAWSTRPRVGNPEPSANMVRYGALPAETGPTWAPDQLSIWPVEGGRFGLDAHYHGRTGAQRAHHQRSRLEAVNIAATVSTSPAGETTLRIGPLQHQAAWLALEAFLGKPVDPPNP
jgi:hypothetical protein